MKINRYKLKPNLTVDDLMKLSAREGGSWINKESKLFISKCFYYKDCEFSIDIAFKDNIYDWDDSNNIIILDEDCCQPYRPFYGENFGADIKNFPCLEFVIKTYNEFMDSIGIFDIVKEN